MVIKMTRHRRGKLVKICQIALFSKWTKNLHRDWLCDTALTLGRMGWMIGMLKARWNYSWRLWENKHSFLVSDVEEVVSSGRAKIKRMQGSRKKKPGRGLANRFALFFRIKQLKVFRNKVNIKRNQAGEIQKSKRVKKFLWRMKDVFGHSRDQNKPLPQSGSDVNPNDSIHVLRSYERFITHIMRLSGESSQDDLRMAWESGQRRLTWNPRVVRGGGCQWGFLCTRWGLWGLNFPLAPKERESSLSYQSRCEVEGQRGDGTWKLLAIKHQIWSHRGITFPVVAKDCMDKKHCQKGQSGTRIIKNRKSRWQRANSLGPKEKAPFKGAVEHSAQKQKPGYRNPA